MSQLYVKSTAIVETLSFVQRTFAAAKAFASMRPVYRHVPDEISFLPNDEFAYPPSPELNDERIATCPDETLYSFILGNSPVELIGPCEGNVVDFDGEDITEQCPRPLTLATDRRLACRKDNDLMLRAVVGGVFVQVAPDLNSLHAARFHDEGMWVVGRVGEQVVLDNYSLANVRLTRVFLASTPELTQWVGSAIGPDGSVYAMTFSGDYVYKFDGDQVSVVFDQSLSARIHALKLIY